MKLSQIRNTVLASCAAFLAVAGSVSADPDPNGTWTASIQGGVMTNGRTAETLDPTRVEFVDKYILGLVIGYERQIRDSRFTFGAELQMNSHFGEQGLFEVAVPVALRYYPQNSWWNAFESFAFGFGYSQYSEISELEKRNYDGTSREGLFYYYLEVEFSEFRSGDTIFARLHHRSNGYDLLLPDGGSNALLLGVRRRF